MFDREEVRLAKTGLRLIRLDDGRIIMMEASLMANDPPSIWNGIQNLQSTISSTLPAVWKLSPNANATYCCIFTPKNIRQEYWLKSWVPRGRTLTGNKAHIACTFPLDPMASYEPVWGIWDEHDSDLQWASAALFMCAQNKVSWAGLAARPQGSDARMYIRRVPNIPISPICCPKEIGIIFVEGFTFLMEDKEEEINVELTKHWVNCFWGIRKKALDPWRVWFQIVSGLKVQRWWRASWWQPSRLLACVDLGDCNTDTWYTAFVWYRYNIIC